MARPQILSGPYGTELEKYGEEANDILTDKGMAAHTEVARSYLFANADTIAMPLFNLRRDVEAGVGNSELRNKIQRTNEALNAAINGRQVNRTVSLGPPGDCYTPNGVGKNSHYSLSEITDLFRTQLDLIRFTPGVKVEDMGQVIFETNPDPEYIIGAVQAAKSCLPNPHDSIYCLTLNHEGKLVDGRSLTEGIKEIMGKVGRDVKLGINCFAPQNMETIMAECEKEGLAYMIKAAFPNGSNKPHHELCGSEGIHCEDTLSTIVADIAQIGKKAELELVSGCCGFDPLHIALLRRVVQNGTNYSYHWASTGHHQDTLSPSQSGSFLRVA